MRECGKEERASVPETGPETTDFYSYPKETGNVYDIPPAITASVLTSILEIQESARK